MKLMVKEQREAKDMSQTELAEKSGISRATIWKLETEAKAQTNVSTLVAIANALDMPVSALFVDNDG